MDDSLQLHWLIQNCVRLVTVRNNLKVSSLHTNDRETIAIMDKLMAPLHQIVDLRELRTFPPLNEILHLQYLRHERMGWLLTIGASRTPILRFFLNAVGRTTRVRYQDFADVDAAIRFLSEHEPSLKGSLTVYLERSTESILS